MEVENGPNRLQLASSPACHATNQLAKRVDAVSCLYSVMQRRVREG